MTGLEKERGTGRKARERKRLIMKIKKERRWRKAVGGIEKEGRGG